jgi:hypothetical protein
MNTAKADQFLSQTATLLRRRQAKIDRLDGNLVEQDIAARREDALIGCEFAKQVDQIEAALKTIGSNLNVDQWCKQNCGVNIRTMRRRKRLYRNWKEYETKRRELGECGQVGVLFGLSLIQGQSAAIAMTGQEVSVRSAIRTKHLPTFDTSRCQFITGNALTELPKLQAQSVNAVVTSPPYWPSRRCYGGKGIGFEKLLAQYIENLVAVFRESRRVLRDDGILWVIIDDSYG